MILDFKSQVSSLKFPSPKLFLIEDADFAAIVLFDEP